MSTDAACMLVCGRYFISLLPSIYGRPSPIRHPGTRPIGVTCSTKEKIVTADESWIYAYEPETKQQFTVWAFEDEPNPTKVVCKKSVRSKWLNASSAKLLMWRLFHLSIVEWSILSGTPQFVFGKRLRRNSKNEQEQTNHCSLWQCELSYIDSNQRLFDRQKREIEGSSAVQSWLGNQWLRFIPAHQGKNSRSTILVVRRCFLKKTMF